MQRSQFHPKQQRKEQALVQKFNSLFEEKKTPRASCCQENIAEYKPQFVTTADLELSRVVCHWLTGPNAKSLIGDGSGNLQSDLVAVMQSSERESPFTAAEKFKYNVGTMNEKPVQNPYWAILAR